MKLIRGFMLATAAIALTAFAAAAPAIAPPGPEPSSPVLAMVQGAAVAFDVAAIVIGLTVAVLFGVLAACEVAMRMGRQGAATGHRAEPYSRRVRSILPRASPHHYLTPT